MIYLNIKCVIYRSNEYELNFSLIDNYYMSFYDMKH